MRRPGEQTEAQFLAEYDPGKYERPSVTVDILVFTVAEEPADSYRRLPEKSLKLLMIKRGGHPFLGKWALPGGFVRMDEGLDEAAYRELREETNAKELYLEQLYTWGDVGRDPRTRVVSVSYLSLADSGGISLKAGDDSCDAGWFTVSCRLTGERKSITEDGYTLTRTHRLRLTNGQTALSAVVESERTLEGRRTSHRWEVRESEGIAFDHAKLIVCGLERLRGKLEYTDIAFHLMPERFTLTQLQQVYETILDRELLKANFRRKLADRVRETNEFTKDAGHRPSKLYRYHPGGDGTEPWGEGE